MNVKNHAPKPRFADTAPIIDFDLERYLLDLELPVSAAEYVRAAQIAPSRHLSGFKSHSIFKPFPKFGCVVGFESRGYEYPFGLMTAYRADVLAIFEQPPKVEFSTLTAEGRSFSIAHTPDLLVLTKTGVEVWAVKDSGEMGTLTLSRPNVWQEKNGVYHSKPLAEYFARWGFRFAVATELNLDKQFVRAAEHLHHYISEFPSTPITPEEEDIIVGFTQRHPGARLGELEFSSPGRRIEVASYLLARGCIFTTWSDADFDHPETIRVFPTLQDERAYHNYIEYNRPIPKNLDELGVRLRQGSIVEIGQETFRVISLTGSSVRLLNEEAEGTEGEQKDVSYQVLLDLKARIGGIYCAEKLFERLFRESPLEHRITWAARKAAIEPYLPGGIRAHECPAQRSIRRHRDAYLKNVALSLPGDSAIFPGYFNCGRKRRSWKPEVENAIKENLRQHNLNPKDCTLQWAWQILVGKFPKADLPSRRTLYRMLGEVNRHKKDWAKGGKRVAVRSEPYFGDDPIAGSPHGNRSWQRAHVDSTPLDLSQIGGGRSWLTTLIDAYDGRVLAHLRSDSRVNTERIRELLLLCVKKHGLLPKEIVCDWGSEHRSAWLALALAGLGITLSFRPKSDPRKGGPEESSFAALMRQIINNLEGNTKLMKKARLVTKAVDPKQFTVWTSEEITALLDEYFDLRNELPRENKPSPNSIACACEERWGAMPRQVSSAALLADLLLPFVSNNGLRKVSSRGTIKNGGAIYGVRGSQNPLLKYAGQFVRVRCKPEDPNILIAFPQRSHHAIHLVRLSCRGPISEVVALAEKRDAETMKPATTTEFSTRDQRVATLTTKIIATEERLKKEKFVAFPSQKAKAPIDPKLIPDLVYR